MSWKDLYHAKLIANTVNCHVFQVIYDGHGHKVISSREGKCANDNQDSDIQSSDDDLNSNMCDDMHIPLFTCTRTESVDRDGTVYCSCHMFECVRIPCTHQACVATYVTKGKECFFLDSIIMMLQCVGGVAICYILTWRPHQWQWIANSTDWPWKISKDQTCVYKFVLS